MVIGGAGDLLLQYGDAQGLGEGWGLRGYFKTHGSFESVMIATGMMGSFIAIYEHLFPVSFWGLAVYGAALDIAFRTLRPMPSLDGYYAAMSPVKSVVWGAIPAVSPLVVVRLLSRGI